MPTNNLAAFLMVMGVLFAGMGAYGMTGRLQSRRPKELLKHPLGYRIDYRQAIRDGNYVSQAEIAGPYLYLGGLLAAIVGAVLAIVLWLE